MGIHPNAILLLVLTPDDLARKTYKGILHKYSPDEDEEDSVVEVDGEEYNVRVMEGSYLESYQISASEGDIVVFGMVTYGYGDKILFDELVRRKDGLEKWAKDVCQEFKCSYKFFVTANYW